MKIVGKGRTATVYDLGDDKVLKLFDDSIPFDWVNKEFLASQYFYNYHLPTPKAYEMRELDHKFGIVYDYVVGDELTEVLMKNKDNPDELIGKLADLHKKILSYDGVGLPSYKKNLYSLAHDHPEMKKKIDNLKEGTALCHGDFHPGNVMVGPDGELIIIDMANLCVGPKAYDVAMAYFLMKDADMPKGFNKFQIIELRKKLADSYLKKMGYSKWKIKRYYDIIRKIKN